MDLAQREYYVNQIISGTTFCRIKGRTYLYIFPSAKYRAYSTEIYLEVYKDAVEEGLLTEAEMFYWLLDNGLWTPQEESSLHKFIEDIDTLKVNIYEAIFKTNERLLYKKAISDTRQELSKLQEKKTSFDHITCEGLAGFAKMRFLIGSSIILPSGKPYWRSFSQWEKPDRLLNYFIEKVAENRLSETMIREISRTDPWRSYWAAAKTAGGGVFNLAAVDLSETQRGILSYAQMYDNIYESPDCPADEVIEDDDALDGWIITQKKKRSDEINKTGVMDKVTNEKIQNSEEIFIMADTVGDAKKIQGANDIGGLIAFKQRMKQIREEGCVNEADLKETRMRVQMEAAQKFSTQLKMR